MLRFQNGCNKVVIEFHVVQFWSEIILVISNRTRAELLSTRMISDQIAGLSLRAGGRGFPPAAQSMAPGYFRH